MTRFISTAWVARGSAEFEAGSALRIHAKAKRTTPANPLHIYVLEGYMALEAPYVEHLRDANIHLHDASAVMAEISARYAALNEITNPYDVRCFVRWLVIERLCPGESLVHLDLDLFFRPTFDEVSNILSACEGTLGSPCVVVATPEWLRIYREMVDRLLSDRGALETEIGFGGTLHRRHIASDQDLTQALERKGGMLPQKLQGLDKWAILNSPLWAPQTLGRPTVYTSDEDFGGKPVLFWHLQNTFATYLTRFAAIHMFRNPLHDPNLKMRLGMPNFRLNPTTEELAFHLLRVQVNQSLGHRWEKETAMTMPHSGKHFDLLFTRAWIANAFIVENQFREIFSYNWWWDEGGFLPVAELRPALSNAVPLPSSDTPIMTPSPQLKDSPLNPMPKTPTPVEQTESQRATAASRGLPANVYVDGDIEGNTVVVEESDRHRRLMIKLRGIGNTIIVRRDCSLDAVFLAEHGAFIEIGERTTMLGTRIVAKEGARCVIGQDCLFSDNVLVLPSDTHKIFDQVTGKRINEPQQIVIGARVWIGEYVQVSKGTIIGNGSAVGAASFLDGDYPGDAIIAGTPAKVLRSKVRWQH